MRTRKMLSAAFALFLGSSPVLASDSRPNIVFIMSDDHAVSAVSAYGDAIMETPNIDRIAEGGVRFDRAYVGNSICGPSRATFLTGLHSHANGFYSNEWSGPFDGTQQTLPSLLQSAGYQTAVVGKWHLYSDPVGFDYWDVIHNAFEQGTYYNPEFRSARGVEETTGYVADLVTDKSIAWLEDAASRPEPFFLVYNHKTPHRNWMPGPEELRDWQESERLPEPPTLLRSLDDQNKARREARMSIAGYMTDNDLKLSPSPNMNEAQVAAFDAAFGKGNAAYEASDLDDAADLRWRYQRYIKTYVASVKSMDRQIGRLLDYLKQRHLLDNTVIVYTSDQGFFLGENGWFDKRWMDEVSSRVPLVMQWPGTIPASSSNAALVQNIDLAPTLLEVAGVSAPEPMHGVSFLSLAKDPSQTWERDLYYHFYENPGFHGVARHYGIRTDRYKLIHYYRNDEWELFDLETDPGDQDNLYGKPGYEALTLDLERRLQGLRAKYAVPAEDPEVPWYHGPAIRVVEQLLRLL